MELCEEWIKVPACYGGSPEDLEFPLHPLALVVLVDPVDRGKEKGCWLDFQKKIQNPRMYCSFRIWHADNLSNHPTVIWPCVHFPDTQVAISLKGPQSYSPVLQAAQDHPSLLGRQVDPSWKIKTNSWFQTGTNATKVYRTCKWDTSYPPLCPA